MEKTEDGLPVVSEDTVSEFIEDQKESGSQYMHTEGKNDPELTERIWRENPHLFKILKQGMGYAPDGVATSYFERGFQLTYELLRREAASEE